MVESPRWETHPLPKEANTNSGTGNGSRNEKESRGVRRKILRTTKAFDCDSREPKANHEPITRRDNHSCETDVGRSKHLLRHLGEIQAIQLTLRHVDEYRNLRFAEKTQRCQAPTPATLDREIALLRRILNYAVECKTLGKNPIQGVRLLRKPNVRKVVLSRVEFQHLLDAAEPEFKPILIVAYDQGLRKNEVLNLRWSQVDLKEGTIRLAPQDTKGEEHRVVYLTKRVLEAIKASPRYLHCDYVFVNPQTQTRWKEVRSMFQRACASAGLHGIWFHDQRRSFVTNARRRGIPESVVMKMSGHKTRSVFDRYNVIEEDDLKRAAKLLESEANSSLENFGHVLDTVAFGVAIPANALELTAHNIRGNSAPGGS